MLPDESCPPGTDLLPEIQHIVILMMENHSYDNYLGALRADDRAHGDGLPVGPFGEVTSFNLAADGTRVASTRRSSTAQEPGVPTQSWRASHIQWDNGANDGFVRGIEQTLPGKDPAVAMGYWTSDQLPFYSSLARTFPLASRWFASCLGPTFPNRRFLTAATANGLIDDVPYGMIDYPKGGTIFDQLDRHGISWTNYHHVARWRILLKRLGGRAGLRVGRAVGLLAGALSRKVLTAAQGNIQFTADLYPVGVIRCVRHLRPIDRFFADAAAGTLPAVSIVDPDFQRSSEENPQDIVQGEGFAAAVVNAVMHGKGWPRTLLLWLYDEHGGYFDHVPPPAAVEPDGAAPHSLLDDGRPVRWLLKALRKQEEMQVADGGGGRYDRYGFRVPAVVVSPFAKPGFVSGTVYDHTSALKLIQRKWNLAPLTARDAAAVDPLDMVDFTAVPPFLDPPDLDPPAVAWAVRRRSWRRRSVRPPAAPGSGADV
jgi:phospholipase C